MVDGVSTGDRSLVCAVMNVGVKFVWKVGFIDGGGRDAVGRRAKLKKIGRGDVLCSGRRMEVADPVCFHRRNGGLCRRSFKGESRKRVCGLDVG